MMNIIEVKNLKYKYNQEDEQYTLNDVSFHVKQGEWLSIITIMVRVNQQQFV